MQGELTADNAALRVVIADNGATSVELRNDRVTLWRSSAPIEIEYWDGDGSRSEVRAGYTELRVTADGITAVNQLAVGGAELRIVDQWCAANGFFRLDRTCQVIKPGTGGFATRIRFAPVDSAPDAVRVFVPGMIYGGPDHLTRSAIGGADTWKRDREFTVLIREDRMPGPLAAFYAPGGSLTLFDAQPGGGCPLVDLRDVAGECLLVDGMDLNSLGFAGGADRFEAVFCAPANEGEVTYQGTTYPGGQLHAWRRRYQTLVAGAELRCSVGLRLSNESSFVDCATGAWRAVYTHLAPNAPHQDIEQITDSLVRRMAAQVRDVPGGGRGLPNYLDAMRKAPLSAHHNQAIMGFTGKNLEAANFMLRWADDHPGSEGETVRHEAEAIIATLIRLRVDPPEGEGYSMDTGAPTLAIPVHRRIYLRSFGDDMKSLARAYLRERGQGREHAAWAAWLERFANWLLTQQRPDGSFPRAWEPGTGQVIDASPFSTYNPIPFLALMTQVTGDRRYLAAALRAGEFCWRAGQSDFVFVGGTIDNPDIIDKEAGTLSLEAYLALAAATGDCQWVERAETAGRFAETWIYIWNAPVCDDDDDAALHWKKGLPTVGLQLIASGHSLVDMYMAFDVDEYARLYSLTGDEHYLDVARLLLHGTKTMISLPGRLFDLEEDGWQQEHWSVAPPRGYGLHRGWLPWVTTSHLAGIYDLKDQTPDLYDWLTRPA